MKIYIYIYPPSIKGIELRFGEKNSIFQYPLLPNNPWDKKSSAETIKIIDKFSGKSIYLQANNGYNYVSNNSIVIVPSLYHMVRFYYKISSDYQTSKYSCSVDICFMINSDWSVEIESSDLVSYPIYFPNTSYDLAIPSTNVICKSTMDLGNPYNLRIDFIFDVDNDNAIELN